MGRMKSMIHAGGKPKRDEPAVSVCVHQRRIAEQIEKGIGGALDLKQFGIGNRAKGADDRVARADHDHWVRVNRPQTGSVFAREAIVYAFEMGLAIFANVGIGKKSPNRGYKLTVLRRLYLADPSPQVRQLLCR